MGRDKAWLQVQGQPLIQRQVALAHEVGAAEVFISGSPERDYSALHCPVLQDSFPEAGPLAGIERALNRTANPFLLVLAVDLPRLDSPFLRHILTLSQADQTGIVPRAAGRIEPLVALYPRTAHLTAASMLKAGRKAARDFAVECVTRGLAVFTDLPGTFLPALANWNAPGDCA